MVIPAANNPQMPDDSKMMTAADVKASVHTRRSRASASQVEDKLSWPRGMQGAWKASGREQCGTPLDETATCFPFVPHGL